MQETKIPTMLYSSKRRTLFIATLALTVCSLHGMAFAVESPPKYTQDFKEGFRKGSNDARAFLESTASDLDRTYDFSAFSVDGQLPPVLRSKEKNAPLIYRCSLPGSFTVVYPAQPLCKDKAGKTSCTTPVNWRDYLLEGLAPESSPSPIAVINKADFKNGEDAARDTALDNMNTLNQMYNGMATYRTLERCGKPVTQ